MITKELQEICEVFTSVIKLDKIRPITDLVEIYSKDGVAHLGVTDNRTILVAEIENKNDIDNVIISLSALTKLVKLTTKEEIILTPKDRYVEFKGNGKYKLPIQCDEMGNEIYLPLEMPKVEKYSEMFNDFNKIKKRNEVGLYSDEGHNEFKLYYNKDGNIVTSDSVIVANTYNISAPLGNIQSFMINQLSCFKEDIQWEIVEDGFCFRCGKYRGYFVNKLFDTFPVEMVEPFLTKDNGLFNDGISLNKKDFLAIIKRQEIFKSLYETPSLILSLDNKILSISNPQNTAQEDIVVEVDKTIKAKVSLSRVMSILKNMEDEFTLYINEQAICFEDNQGFYILAVLEE